SPGLAPPLFEWGARPSPSGQSSSDTCQTSRSPSSSSQVPPESSHAPRASASWTDGKLLRPRSPDRSLLHFLTCLHLPTALPLIRCNGLLTILKRTVMVLNIACISL